MSRYLLPFLFFLLIAPKILLAENTRLPSNYIVNFDLPSERWQVATEPPELAIEAMVVDMAHDKKKKGEPVNTAKLRE